MSRNCHVLLEGGYLKKYPSRNFDFSLDLYPVNFGYFYPDGNSGLEIEQFLSDETCSIFRDRIYQIRQFSL